MATLALSLAGAAIGNAVAPVGFTFLGISGAGIGWTIGGLVGNALFGSSVPDQHGPRLDDLSPGAATEGADMPMLWGDVRVPGFMLWAADLQEVRDEQEIDGKGGGGSTYTGYTYFASFAVSFGEPKPSGKIRRLWANKKLIYDATADADAVSAGYAFTFYDGTQTLPDAVIESHVGTGNAPSYKNQCLMVANRWNISKEFGNRHPVIEAEIVTDGTVSKTLTTLQAGDESSGLGYMQLSPNNERIYASIGGASGLDGGRVIEIDPYSRQIIRTHQFANLGETRSFLFSGPYTVGIGNYIMVYRQETVGDDHINIYELTEDWDQIDAWDSAHTGWQGLAESESALLLTHAVAGGDWQYVMWEKGTAVRTTLTVPTGYTAWDGGSAFYVGLNAFIIPIERDSDNALIWAVYDADGAIWDTSNASAIYTTANIGVFREPKLADDGYIYWPANDSTGTTKAVLIRVNTDGSEHDVIDLDALGAAAEFGTVSGEPFIYYAEESRRFYFQMASVTHEYDIYAGTLTTYSGTSGGTWSLYHYPTGVTWSGDESAGANETYIYANRLGIVTPNGIAVADILDDLAEMVGVTSSLRDFTGISATVGGFVATKQTSARANMEPLLRYALADGVVTGWKLKGVELGGSSAVTLATGQTVAGNRIQHVKPHDIALPHLVELQYMSSDADLQPAMSTAEWYTAPGQQALPISFSMTMADSDAAALAQKFLQLAHGLEQYSFQLPPRFTYLEPADIVTLPDATRVRLTQVDRGHNGVIECVALADNPNDLTASAVASGAGVTAASILSSSPAQLILLDGPLLRDQDADHPGPYMTAFTYGAGFPGAAFHVSSDGSTYAAFGAIGSEPVVGRVSTVPAAVDWEDWDATNTLTVTLETDGELTSATTADVLAGANAALWGRRGRWELVQWKTASLVSAGVYDISDLLRGRRGTDPYIDDHAAGDWFVVLNASRIARHVLPNSAIAGTRYYKAPKQGTPIIDAQALTWTVGSEPLKPYSPIQMASAKDASDLDLSWTRRTRKGGSYGGDNSLTDGVGGPISEDSEAYSVQTLNGAGTVLATRTATTNAFTLTAAMMSADYGATPPTVYWRVAQNSAVVGAGHYCATQTHYLITPAEHVIAALSPGAFWKLDETTGTTVTDASGNAKHGTFLNTPTLGQTALTTLGTSVRFSRASSEYATVPQIIQSSDTAWSVVLFVKPDSLESGAGPSDQHMYFDSRAMVQIMQHQGGKYAAYLRGSDSSDNYLYSTTNPAVGTTCAIGVTFGNGGSGNYFLRLYINGTQEASVDMGTTLGAYQLAGAVLNSIAGGGRFGDGYLDCVAVWSGTELTSTNMADIAAARV